METNKQLGQIRPDSLIAVSIVTSIVPRISIIVETIVVCNTAIAGASFSIYHDNNGTNYDETTALFFEEQSAGRETKIIVFPGGLAIQGKTITELPGNLAVQTSQEGAFTFTVYGKKII